MLQNSCQCSQNCSWKLPDFFPCCGMGCGHTSIVIKCEHTLWPYGICEYIPVTTLDTCAHDCTAALRDFCARWSWVYYHGNAGYLKFHSTQESTETEAVYWSRVRVSMQPRAVVALSRKLLCTGRCSDTMECRFLQGIMQLCSNISVVVMILLLIIEFIRVSYIFNY